MGTPAYKVEKYNQNKFWHKTSENGLLTYKLLATPQA